MTLLDDLAKYERIFHSRYYTLKSVTPNGVTLNGDSLYRRVHANPRGLHPVHRGRSKLYAFYTQDSFLSRCDRYLSFSAQSISKASVSFNFCSGTYKVN